MEPSASKIDAAAPKSPLKRAAILWGPPLVYTALILAASLIPLGKTPAIYKHQDKVLHFVEYAILSALLYRAFLPGLGAVLSMAACIALSSALGGAVEILQPLFGRGADFLDFTANAAGSVSAAFLAAMSGLLRPKRSSAETPPGSAPA